ncbi:MFS transporter [Actinospica sp.]|uniref:MFS transporter n=1 Tax=Actinospica sp. TaxID=1872142 RepID=UPI002BD61610|nr:MFS transporter [Actinospica sp.]HWG25055.1 MFS transporter [Actinospica sp.]
MAVADGASEQAPAEVKQSNRLLFRNRDYTGWWIGATVSEYGTALSTVAYPLLILFVTGSSTSAGVVAAAESIGGLITMLIGGALADRVSRRALLLASPLVQAAVVSTVAVAVLTGHVYVSHVAVVGLIQGLVGGLSGGADFAALRRVVPEEMLPNAFALAQGRTWAIRLAGPSSGGLLFGVARWLPFLGDAVSFLASALGVLLIRKPLGPDPDEHADERESILASIAGGFRYIRSNAYLRFLTIWTGLENCLINGLLILVIVLIHSRHGSATLIGAVSSLGAVGGLIGASVSSRIAKRIPGRPLVIAVSWIMVAATVGIALVPNPWAIGALIALMFVLIAPLNVVFGTYEVRMIPDALMGRVSSAISFGASSVRWLGPLSAGTLASVFSPSVATLVFAGVQAAVAMSTFIASGLHVLGRPIDEVTANA